ncbi:hypothetical protein B9G55_24130 [Saccharibacillus sp. O16]|nr:hypothetical protein B9G55_24130 [Saccharibacillus sp. O16]
MIYILLMAGFLLAISILGKSPKFKGMMGELSVRRQLRKLGAKEYKVLNNLMIQRADGKTSQIDHVVISKHGVFVIETKNYKGWIRGSEKAEYWAQILYRRKERIYSPIRQNYGHIKALEGHLGDSSIPFISIIAFSPRAELKLDPMSTVVIYTTQLVSTIQQYTDIVLADAQVQQIHQALSVKTSHTHRERKKHVSDIKQSLREKEALASAGICPRCKSKLVERQGKNGAFIGCSSFPKCRYTQTSS